MARQGRQKGFTLVEMVMVLVIIGIVASVVAVFIIGPVTAYVDMARRAELTDAAESALRLIARDIRRALPNSLRTDATDPTRIALEMINATDGARYRQDGATTTSTLEAGTGTSETEFDLIGSLRNTNPGLLTGIRVVVNNIPNFTAYSDPNVITGVGENPTLGAVDPATGEQHVTLAAPHTFLMHSPRQRIFFVDGPVSYVCDLGSGQLLRYSGYAIQSTQPVASLAGGTPVSGHVTGCAFDYFPGSATRGALITLSLTLEDSGERVTLLHQVHVDNAS